MQVVNQRRALSSRTISQYVLHRLSGGRGERAVEGTHKSIIRLQLADQMPGASIIKVQQARHVAVLRAVLVAEYCDDATIW